MGSAKMTYLRTFSYGSITVSIQSEIRITTGARTSLRHRDAALFSEPVTRYDNKAESFITEKFTPTSIMSVRDYFQGYWEVDGNILSNVNQTITSGTAFTIESPAPPILPTFVPGSHSIRFVITNPSQNIPFPEISYYVTTDELQQAEMKKLAPLESRTPMTRALLIMVPLPFCGP